MNLFISTLNQLVFLFAFIAIGYILVKKGWVPDNSSSVLSKLENLIFIPALVMGTFINNFTIERIMSAWKLLTISFIIALVVIPLAILISKIITKDEYIQRIFTYGLSFSNFGFMGNAIVSSLFPDIFFEYLIFTLPLWILIYLWGVPRLLIVDLNKGQNFIARLKSLLNPMFIAMLIGMVIGISGLQLPKWMTSLISVSGDCMSPIAMLLTGMVVATISLKKAFTNLSIYIISIIRLLIIPFIFIAISCFVKMNETIFICAVFSLAMPLGLNTIVIPSAFGKDTTVAAGMTVVSHLLSCITIPIVFLVI